MMVTWVNYVIAAIVMNLVRIEARERKTTLPPILSKKFKDVFVPEAGGVGAGSYGGKPTLGSAKATCWARGGSCVDIRDCPSLQMDTMVTGCTKGFKVCCKNFRVSPPTVGQRRRYAIPIYSADLTELDVDSLDTMAMRNSLTLRFP